MATVAIGTYVFEPKDKVENFHGNQLLYIGWEDHLMYCAPLAFPFPGAMPFKAILDQVLPGSYGAHPDFASIEWSKAEWFKSGQPWSPDYNKSIAENGLRHKDVIRFRTPGLRGIQGTCS